MLFNSLTFVVFFALVLCLHRLPVSWRVKKIQLLVASYVFYAAWNPPFVVLLWFSTAIDWVVAHRIHRTDAPGRRRALLAVSVAVNLGLLSIFKYGSFLLDNFVQLMGLLGVSWQPAAPDIVLPVGISFYTFQTMAYTLDVYLRRAEPGKSLLDFSLFVTFFPQLVAGPIVRPTDLVPQFAEPRRASPAQIQWGLGLMTLGLFEKVVVADTLLAPAADAAFKATSGIASLDAWLGVSAFAGQIFCDFAGYSTTAIGASLCLGFSLPDNFRFPYAAIGFSDFWRRWHISLSTWLRDYLYVPLGGNRRGPGRTYVNLMLTMLLGGLWHGASWTFVAWGGLHGAYLAIERWFRERRGSPRLLASVPGQLLAGLGTWVLVNVTWVFFRAPDFPSAGRFLGSMVGAGAGERVMTTQLLVQSAVVTVVLLAVHAFMRERSLEQVVARTPWWLLGAVWGAMAVTLVATQGSSNAFIYFQF